MSTTTTIILIAALIYFVIIPSFKTRVFPVQKLIFMPIAFMYLNYDAIKENFHVHQPDYITIGAGLVLGILLGAFFRRNTRIQADRKKSLIEMPGSYFGLLIFLVIFAVHFVIGYLKSTNPSYLLQWSFGEQSILFFLTLTSSLTIGASGFLFYKYFTNPSRELTETK